MPKRPPTFKPLHNHPDLVKRREKEAKDRYDLTRPNAADRGYDAEWQAFRREIIKKFPACEVCGSTHRLNVDHIVSVRDAPDRRLDETNVRVLCQTHHSRRTAKDQGFAKKKRKRGNA